MARPPHIGAMTHIRRAIVGTVLLGAGFFFAVNWLADQLFYSLLETVLMLLNLNVVVI